MAVSIGVVNWSTSVITTLLTLWNKDNIPS